MNKILTDLGIEFVNDEQVIGKWQNIGWLTGTTDCSLENLREKDGDFEEVYFLTNGDGYWVFEGWTKGKIFFHSGGYNPVEEYSYDVADIAGKKHLLIRYEDRTSVYIKVSDTHYNIDTVGRRDNIDLSFVMDKKILGRWYGVDFVSDISDFCAKDSYDKMLLEYIDFHTDGTAVQKYMDEEWHDRWTKGFLLSQHRHTAAKYEIHLSGDKEYLFVEWKMGNYIYGGMKPDFYVFARKYK